MNKVCTSNLYFGDLHFHTHYSDNRDFASIEEMILAGTDYRLSIFGTADHNHDLDAERWRQTQEETAILREKYPELLILNNCEITFLLGHLNVLIPENIEGTIAEGYRYLYLDPNVLKIINHPYAFNDEWYKRIIPDAVGVEAINGSVFTQAKEKGYRIRSAIEIPSVQVYASYLASNLPVAAIGASDAHIKAEMGYGMTGFWLTNKPDTLTVLEAIKNCQTFAVTNGDIALDWSFNEAKRIISWHVDWEKQNPSENYTVEIYRGDQQITTTHGDGELLIEKAGLYWIAVFDEADIAISSPITVSGEYPGKQLTPQKTTLLNNAIHYIRTDLTCLNMDAEQLSQPISVAFSGDVELQIISGAEAPQIVDAYGNTVLYDVINKGSSRVIIDKECGTREFEEFYLWFSRNEIHEYVFANIAYRKVDQTFFFTGHLLPKKMAHQKDIATRYQHEIGNVRNIVDEHTRFKIYVSTLPSHIINIHLDSKLLPYKAFDHFTGLTSMFVYVEKDVECPSHLLERVKELQYDSDMSLDERIYQIFV
jgi:hypothetical protein